MTKRKDGKMLKPFIEMLEVAEGITHRDLTLMPLRGGNGTDLDYMLAADALADCLINITEVNEGGSVPELLVTSRSKVMILLLDGEELVGAKQNRILNTTVLLPPKAKTTIPVSCVEQGRWRRTSSGFASGGYAPSKLRARKSHDVGRNLRSHGEAESDQGAVWDEVAESLHCMEAESPTMAMRDAVERRRDSLDKYVEGLPYPEGARGVFVAIGGRFVAMDLFDKPRTLEKVWPRLVTGYAMDAVGRRGRGRKGYSEKRVNLLLEKLQEIPCDPCPSVGVGEDWRFENDRVVGQALIAEDTCVHLSVFPNEIAQRGRDDSDPRIEPPSRRRPKQDDEPTVY